MNTQRLCVNVNATPGAFGLANLQLAGLAGEAYGLGCATGDRFYAGVEAVASYLLTGVEHPELRELLIAMELKQRATEA